MTSLQYTVDKVGNIVSLKTIDNKRDQSIIGSKVEAMPQPIKRDRFAQFKRTVCHQELGAVIKYTGFEDAKELQRAKACLYRYKRDIFMQSALNGSYIELKADYVNIALYVVRRKNEDS